MTDETKRTFTKTLLDYFGKKPGQTIGDFGQELKELSDEEKTQLCDGIEDGSFDY